MRGNVIWANDSRRPAEGAEHHHQASVLPQVGDSAGAGDEQHVGGQLQQPLERYLRGRGIKAGGGKALALPGRP